MSKAPTDSRLTRKPGPRPSSSDFMGIISARSRSKTQHESKRSTYRRGAKYRTAEVESRNCAEELACKKQIPYGNDRQEKQVQQQDNCRDKCKSRSFASPPHRHGPVAGDPGSLRMTTYLRDNKSVLGWQFSWGFQFRQLWASALADAHGCSMRRLASRGLLLKWPWRLVRLPG